MHITELFTAQLEREVERSRHALERVPDGLRDYKPHPKSMPFGYLATLVATMPSWIAMIVERDFLDLAPKDGAGYKPPPPANSAELVAALDQAAASARAALAATSDAHLLTPWQLRVGGRVVAEDPRQVVIADTFAHLAHHRGQMTVYLRLNGAPVPALFGPSADDQAFA
jgi:uncharacterized damage-inducible protein DinB